MLYRLETQSKQSNNPFENRLCTERKNFVYIDAEGYESHEQVFRLLRRYIDEPHEVRFIGMVSGSPEALSLEQSRHWLPREAR